MTSCELAIHDVVQVTVETNPVGIIQADEESGVINKLLGYNEGQMSESLRVLLQELDNVLSAAALWDSHAEVLSTRLASLADIDPTTGKVLKVHCDAGNMKELVAACEPIELSVAASEKQTRRRSGRIR